MYGVGNASFGEGIKSSAASCGKDDATGGVIRVEDEARRTGDI